MSDVIPALKEIANRDKRCFSILYTGAQTRPLRPSSAAALLQLYCSFTAVLMLLYCCVTADFYAQVLKRARRVRSAVDAK